MSSNLVNDSVLAAAVLSKRFRRKLLKLCLVLVAAGPILFLAAILLGGIMRSAGAADNPVLFMLLVGLILLAIGAWAAVPTILILVLFG
ncbi:MAG: hypothetical protein WA199_00845, partial [Xanthobacteraceae bacterium]